MNKDDTPEYRRVPSSCPLVETSSFATLFPTYREHYLIEVWPQVEKEMRKYGIKAVLDAVEGTMTVSTTRYTKDPYIIIKSKEMIKLMARSVPFKKALNILRDDMQCDIIKIGGGKDARFIRRRERLIGPDGATLKALELLTECYVVVQGNTVACMGSYAGLKQVRRIVEECMYENKHPIYNIKTLMIKRELAKNPDLKNESWDRFLPKFKAQRRQGKRKVKYKKKSKTDRPLFAPAQTPRKEDLEMESGEYWLSKKHKRNIALQKRKREANEESKRRQGEKRRKRYTAPEEHNTPGDSISSGSGRSAKDIAASIKTKSTKKGKRGSKHASSYVISSASNDGDGRSPAKKKKKKSTTATSETPTSEKAKKSRKKSKKDKKDK